MEQSIQQLMDWLNEHLNHTIVIDKHEIRDLDKVLFNLEGVEFRSSADVVDEYLGTALILRGNGNTLNADGELVALPQSTYDLVVDGLRIVNTEDDKIEINTDRAKYSITVE